MPTEAQSKLISRLTAGPAPQPPIPTVPKLPAFLKERFPDKAAEIEAYDKAWADFMKKTGTIQQ